MASVKLEIVNRPDVDDASQDIVISDITTSGEIFEDAGAYYKVTINLEDDETLVGTTDVTLENGVTIPVSSDTLLGYTSFSDSLDDLYLNGNRNFSTTIQDVTYSVFSDIAQTQFSTDDVTITMKDNHTASLVGIFKMNTDEDQNVVKFRVVLDTPPKVDTTITIEIEGVEKEVTFPAVTDAAVLASGEPVSQILEVSTDLQQSDVYVDPQSLDATITKINDTLLTEGIDSEGGQIKYLDGSSLGDFERLQLFRESATSLVKDTLTNVNIDLTANETTSEDNGTITYTATLRESDLSNEELTKHKGVKVTLDEKDAEGNYIVIMIAEGKRSGSTDITVHRDDIYIESDSISNKIKSVENVIADDEIGAFESLVANTETVSTTITDDSDQIKVTLQQVKADGSAFGADESKDIKEGESAYYKVEASHDNNNVNTPTPITGTVGVLFTNGSTTFDDYLVNDQTLAEDGNLTVQLGSTIEVKAKKDSTYEGEDGESFSLSLIEGSAVPTDAPAGTDGFESVHYIGEATTIIKENKKPVDVKLVQTDKDGNILADDAQVVESQSAYYKAILVEAGTNTEIENPDACNVTVSITDESAKEIEDYSNKIFIEGIEITDKKVAIGRVFMINTVDNLFDEEEEAYNVSISNPELSSKYKVEAATSTVTTTITDDEDPIMIGLQQVKNEAGDAFEEGESKEVKEGEVAYYKVIASKGDGNDVESAIEGSVDVKFDGLSTDDYDKSGQTLQNVAFGSVISTAMVDDYIKETGETFTVSLVEGSAKPTDILKSFEKVSLAAPVTTTIEDNDSEVTLKLIPVDPTGKPLVDEKGNPISVVKESKQAYYKAVLFDATNNEIVDTESTVRISLSDGSATKAEDYHDKIFVGGEEVTDKKVKLGTIFSVNTKDNLLKEKKEDFAVTMGDFSNADHYEKLTYINPTTTTITDDIDPVEVQIIQVSDADKKEGEMATYKAILVNQATGEEVLAPTGHVDITFNDGTTQGASDFTSATANVALNTEFTADIVDDVIAEDSESFSVVASNFKVGDQDASGIYESVRYAPAVTTHITDNDSVVTIKLIPLDPTTGKPLVDENGNPISVVQESKQAHYVAELYHDGKKISDPTATVDVLMSNGSALAGEDYVDTTKTVTLGEPFTIDTVDNVYKETDETFTVSIQADTLNSTTAYEKVQSSEIVTTIIDNVDTVTATLRAQTEGTTTVLDVTLSQTMPHTVKNPLTFTLADNGTVMKDALGNDITMTIGEGETSSRIVIEDMAIGTHDITFLTLPSQENVGDFEAITPVYDCTTNLEIKVPCPLETEDDCAFIDQGDTKKLDVLANDSGTNLHISSVDGVEHGSVSITDGGKSLVYTADNTVKSSERLNTDTGVIESVCENPFLGTESFSYTVEDEYGQKSTATVNAHIMSTGNKREIYNGDASDDYIIAGKGNDYLSGGAGDDHYFFSKGDGDDIIVDSSGEDRIVFSPKMDGQETLSFKLENDGNLVISYGEEHSDHITVKYQEQLKSIERIEMCDGAYLDSGDIDRMVQVLGSYVGAEMDISQMNQSDYAKDHNLAIIAFS